jgi:hypothetical protein
MRKHKDRSQTLLWNKKLAGEQKSSKHYAWSSRLWRSRAIALTCDTHGLVHIDRSKHFIHTCLVNHHGVFRIGLEDEVLIELS